MQDYHRISTSYPKYLRIKNNQMNASATPHGTQNTWKYYTDEEVPTPFTHTLPVPHYPLPNYPHFHSGKVRFYKYDISTNELINISVDTSGNEINASSDIVTALAEQNSGDFNLNDYIKASSLFLSLHNMCGAVVDQLYSIQVV